MKSSVKKNAVSFFFPLPIRSTNFSVDQWKKKQCGKFQEYENYFYQLLFTSNLVVNLCLNFICFYDFMCICG